MALLFTTLSAACAASDTQITLTATTSLAAGMYLRIDGEDFKVTQEYTSGNPVKVLRGQNGTVVGAHVSGAYVGYGVASDFANPAAQTEVTYPIAGRARTITSYTSAGAIALPTAGSDAFVILNGTVAADMTLADPGKDINGSIVYIVAGGAAAFTVTAASGFGAGGASYDKLTFAAGAQVAIWAVAADGAWCIPNSPAIAGTATNLLATIG